MSNAQYVIERQDPVGWTRVTTEFSRNSALDRAFEVQANTQKPARVLLDGKLIFSTTGGDADDSERIPTRPVLPPTRLEIPTPEPDTRLEPVESPTFDTDERIPANEIRAMWLKAEHSRARMELKLGHIATTLESIERAAVRLLEIVDFLNKVPIVRGGQSNAEATAGHSSDDPRDET